MFVLFRAVVPKSTQTLRASHSQLRGHYPKFEKVWGMKNFQYLMLRPRLNNRNGQYTNVFLRVLAKKRICDPDKFSPNLILRGLLRVLNETFLKSVLLSCFPALSPAPHPPHPPIPHSCFAILEYS